MAAASSTTRRSVASPADIPASEEISGFEIFYVPELSGWQYRDPDERTSEVSYRSLFLARKAVNEAAERIAAKAAPRSDEDGATDTPPVG